MSWIAAWKRSWNAPNASYYLQGRGYTELDVERAASEVAVRSIPVYKARPLNGIWAVSPYLHNGSVPNL